MICLQQPQQSRTLVHILADLLVDHLVDYLVDNQRANAKRFPSLLMNTKEIQPESKPESTKLTKSQPRTRDSMKNSTRAESAMEPKCFLDDFILHIPADLTLVDFLLDCLVDFLVYSLVIFLIVSSWLSGWVSRRLPGWLSGWLADSLVDFVIGWVWFSYGFSGWFSYRFSGRLWLIFL